MPTQVKDIQITVKSYILQEFLPGENPEELQGSTPLITGGILDSISTIKLVAFLEDQFGISFEAFEMNADYLNSLDMIAGTVDEKLARS